MKYGVVVKKPFKYIRTYTVVKKAHDTTNAASRFVQRLVDRFIVKREE